MEFCKNLAQISLHLKLKSLSSTSAFSHSDLSTEASSFASDYSFPSAASDMKFLRSENTKSNLLGVSFRLPSFTIYELGKEDSPEVLRSFTSSIKQRGIFFESIDFDPNFDQLSAKAGKILIACSDGCSRLFTCDFELSENQKFITYQIGPFRLIGSRYISYTNHFLSVSQESSYAITDLDSEKTIFTTKAFDSEASSFEVSPDGSLLMMGNIYGLSALYDLRSCQLISQSKVKQSEIQSVTSFSMNINGIYCTGYSNGRISVSDIRKEGEIVSLPAHIGGVIKSDINFGDGSVMISGGRQGEVRIWDWFNCKIEREYKVGEKPNLMDFNIEKKMFASGHMEKRLELYSCLKIDEA